MRQKIRHLREASASQTKLAMHPNWDHFTPKNHNLLHNNFMWQYININTNISYSKLMSIFFQKSRTKSKVKITEVLCNRRIIKSQNLKEIMISDAIFITATRITSQFYHSFNIIIRSIKPCPLHVTLQIIDTQFSIPVFIHDLKYILHNPRTRPC
ncbi:hypothetical protein NC653_020892 [Populus alba x Populus x berolinensis]|uniref:Uncharacterized protein n=1 Tax=Populus alba x Populus x berolinensis TaxID=444605 RepID=A0AAD6QD43_9ROSI|nr:hypothetical protein NC653_020892 [Populus alba x Populus x berolinensis]